MENKLCLGEIFEIFMNNSCFCFNMVQKLSKQCFFGNKIPILFQIIIIIFNDLIFLNYNSIIIRFKFFKLISIPVFLQFNQIDANIMIKHKKFNIRMISLVLISFSFICFFHLRIRQKNYQLEIKKTPMNNKNEHFNNILMNKRFSMSSLNCKSEKIDIGRSYTNEIINIFDCFFTRSSGFSDDGGVVYVNSGSLSLNINSSMFYNCACSCNGGAIYFSSINSYLKKVCANKCFASTQYHFAYICASPNNQVDYLSVSYCSQSLTGNDPIRLSSGDQKLDNTNSSMNSVREISCLSIVSPSSFMSSHCTFSNNVNSVDIAIYFSATSGTMSSANIIHNNSPSLGVIYVSENGTPKMNSCLFLNNQNKLFYVLTGSLEVSHSFIDHSSSLSANIAVVTSNNNSFTKTISYQLNFYGSYYCNADNPLIGQTPQFTNNQTPIRSNPETLKRTNEETFRMTFVETLEQTLSQTTIHRSYEECKCTNQLAYHIPIKSIFSFSFICTISFVLVS